nr:ribonuclease H-like domain-containing protein [Tanacetum cinerariifolium]
MDQVSAHIVAASKVPMLKPGEFEIWRMIIEQYIQMVDYALWEVIENGATLLKTQVVNGVITMPPITTAEERHKEDLNLKSKIHLSGINKWNQSLISIEYEESVCVHKISLLEDMDQDFAHMVAAFKVSMLKPGEFEILRIRIKQYIQMIDYALWEVIENGTTLPITQIMDGVITMMPITTAKEKVQRRLEVKAKSTLMMVISNKHQLKFNSIKDAKRLLKATKKIFVNTANGVTTTSTQVNVVDNLSNAVICAFLASQPNSPQLAHEDLEQIHPDEMEEIDLRWQMTMLAIKARRFLKKTRRKLTVNCNETLGFDMSKVECYNCHKRGHFARECRAPRTQDNKHKKSTRRSVPVESPAFIALVSCDGLNKLIECQIVDNYKKGLRYESYNVVPPPYIGNFMPPKLDLSYTGLDEFAVKPVVENKSSEEKTKAVRKNTDASIIKEHIQVSDGLDPQKKLIFLPNVQGNPQMDLHDKGVIDSGCSRHIKGNMSYLIDYEEIDGGYVSFGGNPKGGKITRKCTIKTVVIDDFSRFTWVFFLATKDETSVILKSFITRIENLVDHKVKVTRCDSRTEFKNSEMNQFCEMKGILRQFSVSRLPQQNGVAEWRNRTLIKAARTMLADSKLLTTFWAKAVNTARYVQNKVLVVKPHNKTPYELFHGKFDGKADEGFFVGYSLNSKAFIVFNSRTRIVEENLHIRFSKNTPNVVDPKSSQDDGFKPSTDDGKKVNEDLRKEYECNDQDKEDNVNSTNNVNTVSSIVNVTGTNEDNKLPFDPNMPALEDVSIFNFSNDDEDDDIVADMNNMDTTIQVSPILTTRIHKDHPLNQVIRDLRLATQTRQMSKNLEEHGKIEEQVYICQPPGFEDPDFPNRVYKMSSIGELTFFLGLQVKQKNDGIFISQDKCVAEILKNFRFAEVKNASTPMETQKPLLKDEDGEEVDVHMYRSMIGSLMYLTSSRPLCLQCVHVLDTKSI